MIREHILDILSLPTTKRLFFRLLNAKYINYVYRQFSDQDMCKYFSEPPFTIDEAKEIIEHYQESIGKGYYMF
jgi:ribosomal-protein-alanine N-acetyltransferase